jgi:hypothetical protein
MDEMGNGTEGSRLGRRPGAELTIRLSPVLREALASAGVGEDLDEALLRVLKSRYPEQATMLLSALTRLIEIEGKPGGERKEETIKRLADADPGPEIALKISAGRETEGTGEGTVSTVSERTVIRIGDQEYQSLDEVPAHLRAALARGMNEGGTAPRTGCSLAVAGVLLGALLGGVCGTR